MTYKLAIFLLLLMKGNIMSYRTRAEDFWTAICAFVGAMVLLAALAVFEAWAVMLLLGAAHSHDARIPAFGFAATFFLSWAISIVTYHNTNSSKD
jgi:hypothetical protein